MLALIERSIRKQFVIRWVDLMCRSTTQGCTQSTSNAVSVEEVPGGEINDSSVLSGVMLNKAIAHP